MGQFEIFFFALFSTIFRNDLVPNDGTQFCFGSTINDPERVKDSCQGREYTVVLLVSALVLDQFLFLHCIILGDSGGPVQCLINNAWTIVGVVSYGGNCAEVGKAAVYTRIASPKIYDFVNKYL